MAFCEHCTQGYILSGEPKNSMQPNGAYFAPAAGDNIATGKAVILFTDIFGLPLKNCKIQADMLAERLGVDVWVPDVFNGQPITTVEELSPYLKEVPEQKMGILNRIGLIFLMVSRIPRIFVNTPGKVADRGLQFLKKIKEEKKYERIGIVGYCYGGIVCIRTSPDPVVDTVVIAHPGNCTLEQIKKINAPTSWICAEEDDSFPPQLRNDSEAVYAARKDKEDFVDYEFVDYPGTVHGFAARPALHLPQVKEAFEKSFEQTVNWFSKTL